jgi:hypothetical protein
MHMRTVAPHLHAVSGTGFGASDTSRPPPPAAGAGGCPSRSAAEVQAALTVLRRSSDGGGGFCRNGGDSSTPNAARSADCDSSCDCSLGGSSAGTTAAGKASGGSSGRLDLSAYAALLAAFRVPDPSDAAPPTPERMQYAWRSPLLSMRAIVCPTDVALHKLESEGVEQYMMHCKRSLGLGSAGHGLCGSITEVQVAQLGMVLCHTSPGH